MIIQIQKLKVELPGGIKALDDVSCVLDSRQCGAYALLGANGAGKSTLLNALLGLAPIVSGSIMVDGLTVEKRNLRCIREKVGIVFQNSDDQLFSQTVEEDVSFGPNNQHLSEVEVKKRTAEAMADMGISNLAGRDVARLSGGEKRRAALAGVLAMQPECVLLDEPTSMLDPRGCRELAESLTKLKAMKILATHDLDFARRVCPFCIILKEGRILAEGPTCELLDNHQLLVDASLW